MSESTGLTAGRDQCFEQGVKSIEEHHHRTIVNLCCLYSMLFRVLLEKRCCMLCVWSTSARVRRCTCPRGRYGIQCNHGRSRVNTVLQVGSPMC